MAHRFTTGVKEEFQIIDPDALELRSHEVQLLSAAARGLGRAQAIRKRFWIYSGNCR
jgi:hypothetical protein